MLFSFGVHHLKCIFAWCSLRLKWNWKKTYTHTDFCALYSTPYGMLQGKSVVEISNFLLLLLLILLKALTHTHSRISCIRIFDVGERIAKEFICRLHVDYINPAPINNNRNNRKRKSTMLNTVNKWNSFNQITRATTIFLFFFLVKRNILHFMLIFFLVLLLLSFSSLPFSICVRCFIIVVVFERV